MQLGWCHFLGEGAPHSLHRVPLWGHLPLGDDILVAMACIRDLAASACGFKDAEYKFVLSFFGFPVCYFRRFSFLGRIVRNVRLSFDGLSVTCSPILVSICSLI